MYHPTLSWPARFLKKPTESLLGSKGVPLYVMSHFSLATFKILSLPLTVDILLMLCLCVGPFKFILFGTLCTPCTWIFISFFRFVKFSVIISSNLFSIPFSLSCPSGISIMCRLVCFIMGKNLPAMQETCVH